MQNILLSNLPLQITWLTIYPNFTNLLIFFVAIFFLVLCVLGILMWKKHRKTKLESCITNFEIQQVKYDNSIPKCIKLVDLNRDLEPFGFAYYPPQDIFYSNMICWQRECGYCELYDEGCAVFSMIIDCEPVYFSYGGKRWLIEFWKGQYGMTTGCEIGVYNTTEADISIPGIFEGPLFHCAADEDHLNIGFTLYKNGELLFYRKEVHWWLTGFRLGEFSEPSELVMKVEVTLKDEEMLNAFLGGLKDAGYTDSDITIQNTTVSLTYDTPRNKQPSTRTPFIEGFMQANNQRNCAAYQYATDNFGDTLNKLCYVKTDAPKMYRKILNVAGTKDILAVCDIIKEYLGIKELDEESIKNTISHLEVSDDSTDISEETSHQD